MSVRRDLHDQIGSSLAGMAMQLEVAQRSIGPDTAQSRRVLADLRTDMADLIANVRRLVANRNAAGAHCSVEMALRSMIGRMSRVVADRLDVSLELDPMIRTVRADIGWAAFWIVREAVTNVLKHSTADRCAIVISVRDNELTVRVEDNGTVIPKQRRRTGGAGLINMTERAVEFGGWCTTGPVLPTGFLVVANFPLTTDAAQPARSDMS
jgi:signal transduction histidine kinase